MGFIKLLAFRLFATLEMLVGFAMVLVTVLWAVIGWAPTVFAIGDGHYLTGGLMFVTWLICAVNVGCRARRR